MKSAILYLFLSAVALFLALFLSFNAPQREIRISCDIAEISPDFTPAMREACRKARMEKIK